MAPPDNDRGRPGEERPLDVITDGNTAIIPVSTHVEARREGVGWLRCRHCRNAWDAEGLIGFGLDCRGCGRPGEPMPLPAAQYVTGAAAEAHGNGWEPLDLDDTLAGLQDGTLTRPEPTVGRFGDRCLFYPGRINGVHGDSNAAKTWTALVTCRQEIELGHTVVYVDLEDDPAGIIGRLLDLGVDADAVRKRFVYLRPDGRVNQTAADSLVRLLAERTPSLAVVDSAGEALALEGANPNADEEVARWFRLLPRLLARQGAAVLLLDHATKAGDNDLWPIGSQRKRAAITGAAYVQRVVRPFAIGQDGAAVLVCAKDRGGNYPTGRRVAELRLTDGAWTLEPASEDSKPGGAFRPTVLMERISDHLTTYPGASWYAIREAVRGKTDGKQLALQRLIAEGYVTTEDGPRGSTRHTLIKRYTEAGDTWGQVDVSPPPGPVPVPIGGGQGDRSDDLSLGTGRGQVGTGHENGEPDLLANDVMACRRCSASWAAHLGPEWHTCKETDQ
jgi:hypothetical protein